MKYRCTICGHIYDDLSEEIPFKDLPEDWVCPMCGVPKNLFVEVEKEEVVKEPRIFNNAIAISENNPSIKRIMEKCVDCGICKTTCIQKEGIKFDKNSDLCLNCGQCIQACPMNAIIPKSAKENMQKNINNKICIAYTSPATRVAIGEILDREVGSFEQEKLVGLLRKLGFNYVLDVTFAADLTIMEEASELVNRINNNGVLPMFTSCCPSWVKYVEINHPELINNLSSCKSPIGMMGMMVKEYFANKMNIDKNNIYTVAITPCTAKKYEISLDNIDGTDDVLTLLELEDIIKEQDIKYDDIENSNYDSIFGEGSGAGVIFGNTGGVMTAALRTAYYLLTNNKLNQEIKFNKIDDNLSEAVLNINGININVAVINELSKVSSIIEEVKNGTSKYQFIEVMNCRGGCIGGGGQPRIFNDDFEQKKKRITSLQNRDDKASLRYSYENPDIVNIYKEFLGSPLSEKSKELLHTKYEDKSSLK